MTKFRSALLFYFFVSTKTITFCERIDFLIEENLFSFNFMIFIFFQSRVLNFLLAAIMKNMKILGQFLV